MTGKNVLAPLARCFGRDAGSCRIERSYVHHWRGLNSRGRGLRGSADQRGLGAEGHEQVSDGAGSC